MKCIVTGSLVRVNAVFRRMNTKTVCMLLCSITESSSNVQTSPTLTRSHQLQPQLLLKDAAAEAAGAARAARATGAGFGVPVGLHIYCQWCIIRSSLGLRRSTSAVSLFTSALSSLFFPMKSRYSISLRNRCSAPASPALPSLSVIRVPASRDLFDEPYPRRLVSGASS